MPTARLIENDRKTTSSGRAKTGAWTLEFAREDKQRHDPLMGWVGSSDTRQQIRLSFDSKDAGLAYCARNGLDPVVVPAPPVKLKLQAYADNFR